MFPKTGKHGKKCPKHSPKKSQNDGIFSEFMPSKIVFLYIVHQNGMRKSIVERIRINFIKLSMINNHF